MDEVWKDIDGYNGVYKVSNLARVKSLKNNKIRILKQSINKQGYVFTSINKKVYKIHQLVAIYFLNHTPCGMKKVVHHKDNNKLNNNKNNLEITTQRDNCYTHHFGTSKYKGVYWHIKSNKWMAQITINGFRKYLGCYTNEIDASNAYADEYKSNRFEIDKEIDKYKTYL
tara:strand:+ start:6098 stop:6607 length:510 start_codon:yes stop_codon:yes gene_type:complete